MSLDGTLRSGSCVQGWGEQREKDAARTDKAIVFGVKEKAVLRCIVLVAS